MNTKGAIEILSSLKRIFTDEVISSNDVDQIIALLQQGEKNQQMKIYYVRPVIKWFAFGMEKRLREKDNEKGKDGWHDGKLNYYISKAMEDLLFVVESIRNRNDNIQNIGINPCNKIKSKDIITLMKKCIDSSNFIMMLADNFRDELTKRR